MMIPTQDATDYLQRQHRLGWESFFEGRPATGWCQAQDNHFRSINSKQSGKRWLIQVLRKLFDTAWDLWQFRNQVLYNEQQNLAHELQIQAIKQEFQN